MNDNFRWKTAINVSANRNEVISLHPDYTQFSYGQEGFSMAYQMRIKEGGKLGDIYGNAFARNADGTIQTNADGTQSGKPVTKTFWVTVTRTACWDGAIPLLTKDSAFTS